jgi:hypothetical protein
MLVVFIIASVCYYRWKLKTTGDAPFTPPSWAPRFMYPRHSVQIQEMESYREI